MREYTSEVTLVFVTNNLEAKSKKEYIAKVKSMYRDMYHLELKTAEITKIKRRTNGIHR